MESLLPKGGPLIAAAELPGGYLLGDCYRVMRKLGAGGMGAVYEVERTTDHRRLAAKVLREIPEGHTISMRAATAPASAPWLRALVKSCQPVDSKVWRVGCAVDHPNPWALLLERA